MTNILKQSKIMDILLMHDRESYRHSIRVAKVAFIMATASSVSYPSILPEAIRYGALHHDMGKLSVPKHLLNKKEDLNPEEDYIVKQHASIGYMLATGLNIHPEIRKIVHSHHESWDGTGYPKGLKGDDINLNVGICAAADCFDAMISKRSYKKSKSITEAVELINKMSGTKFNPAVVDIFNAVNDKLRIFYEDAFPLCA